MLLILYGCTTVSLHTNESGAGSRPVFIFFFSTKNSQNVSKKNKNVVPIKILKKSTIEPLKPNISMQCARDEKSPNQGKNHLSSNQTNRIVTANNVMHRYGLPFMIFIWFINRDNAELNGQSYVAAEVRAGLEAMRFERIVMCFYCHCV
jgi:hypothetical protein